MNGTILENLIYFGVVFIIVLLIYLLIISRRRLKRGIIKDMGEIGYLVVKFKLDPAKINLKKLLLTTSFINAFIMAFTCMIIAAIPLKIVWQMLIGFVILIALVYSVYEIFGRFLAKKGLLMEKEQPKEDNLKDKIFETEKSVEQEKTKDSQEVVADKKTVEKVVSKKKTPKKSMKKVATKRKNGAKKSE